jgi:DNA-binding CsgD family transcriptional regulator
MANLLPVAAPEAAVDGWDSLTSRDREIAHLVVLGMTNQQIARRVFLSPHTVNYHLRQIFKKLGISSRVQLAGFIHAYSINER